MEAAGYIASILIGISLGLIGGGGSILTVPVLVYLFHIAPSQATSYSLFIVGATSVIGAWNNYRIRQVNFATVLLFAPSSIITVILTRKWLVPAIPDVLITAGNFSVTKSTATMLLFAVLMMTAAIPMIRSSPAVEEQGNRQQPGYWKLIMYGVMIGLVTGLLGAGGGFLLIPALVFLLKLQVKTAIGTSLLIIALNSLIGFTGDLGHTSIDWTLLLTITALAIIGIVAGSALNKKTDGAKLKKAFGWFVLGMGAYVILHELIT